MQRLSERLALAKTIKQLNINDADAIRLAQRLVYETTRSQNLIDKFINKIIKPKKIDEYDLGVQAFLRLYVYQTRIKKNWTEIDFKEAENITQTARSILGWRTLRKIEPYLGFLLTEKPKTIFENINDEEQIALSTYHPTWFVNYCFRLFGRKEAITLLKGLTQPPPTYIRLNTLHAPENTILNKLAEEGIQTEKVNELKYAYKIIKTKHALAETESFKEGFFYVQDKASCYAAEAANPKAGMTVLDVCAAPGAKTTYLAQLMKNQGSILSVDFSRRRMRVWEREISSMGTKIAEPIVADASKLLPFAVEADVVVLDPPCTSTGVFGKSPSAKWRLTPQSIEDMAEIQRQIINNCADFVKIGGTLVYSTCSVTVEENEIIIERFLKHHAEFSLGDLTPKIGLAGLRGFEKCRRLYPHLHKCNGFFIAKLVKRS